MSLSLVLQGWFLICIWKKWCEKSIFYSTKLTCLVFRTWKRYLFKMAGVGNNMLQPEAFFDIFCRPSSAHIVVLFLNNWASDGVWWNFSFRELLNKIANDYSGYQWPKIKCISAIDLYLVFIVSVMVVALTDAMSKTWIWFRIGTRARQFLLVRFTAFLTDKTTTGSTDFPQHDFKIIYTNRIS